MQRVKNRLGVGSQDEGADGAAVGAHHQGRRVDEHRLVDAKEFADRCVPARRDGVERCPRGLLDLDRFASGGQEHATGRIDEERVIVGAELDLQAKPLAKGRFDARLSRATQPLDHAPLQERAPGPSADLREDVLSPGDDLPDLELRDDL